MCTFLGNILNFAPEGRARRRDERRNKNRGAFHALPAPEYGKTESHQRSESHYDDAPPFHLIHPPTPLARVQMGIMGWGKKKDESSLRPKTSLVGDK